MLSLKPLIILDCTLLFSCLVSTASTSLCKMMDTDVADWHEIPPVARVMTNAITCVTLFALGICLGEYGMQQM